MAYLALLVVYSIAQIGLGLWIGRRVRSALSTRDPYEFTANSVLEITARIDALPTSLGVVTPSQAFGADFALAVPGCSRVDAP